MASDLFGDFIDEDENENKNILPIAEDNKNISTNSDDITKLLREYTGQEAKSVVDWKKCPCGNNYTQNDNTWACQNCGQIMKYINTDDTVNSANHKRSTLGNKTSIISRGSSDDPSRQYDISKRLDFHNKITNILKVSKGRQIHPVSIKYAVEQYCDAQKRMNKVILRGSRLQACFIVLANIHSRANGHGIFTNKQLARMIDVQQKTIGDMQQTINLWYANNYIDLPASYRDNPRRDLLLDYMKRIELPKECLRLRNELKNKYYHFCIDILDECDKQGLNGINNTLETTKCSAVLYFLTLIDVEFHQHVDASAIHQLSEVSITSFEKYRKMLLNNPIFLKHIFAKYQIPMPSVWRGKI
jgi:hypothetical protein